MLSILSIKLNNFIFGTSLAAWKSVKLLWYPTKTQTSYIKTEHSIPEPDWKVINYIVKRRSISTFGAGRIQIHDMIKCSDTDKDNNYLETKRLQNTENQNF